MAARALLPASLVLLAACAGHGTHTSELKDDATSRMEKMRAAADYDMAFQHFTSGDLDHAVESVDSSIRLNPSVPIGHLLKARILIERSEIASALKCLEAGRALDPGNAEFPYYSGISFERLSLPEKALESFQNAAKLDPAKPQYVLAAAEVLIDLGRLDEAKELLEDRSSEFQYQPGFRQALGHIAMMEGDIESAVHYFSEAALLAPDEPVFREDLVRAHIAALRFGEAAALLETLVKEPGYEDRRDLQHMLASCLIEVNEPVEARTILQRLTRAEGGAKDVEAWIRLCDVALMLKDDDLLQRAATRIISVAPERYEGYLTLALWQQRQGQVEPALKNAEMAVERAGPNQAPARLREVLLRSRNG